MRPMWVEFPSDATTFSLETQYMVGSALLVVPVVEEGASAVKAYLPNSDSWIDTHSQQIIEAGNGGELSVGVSIEYIPVFQRGGTIVPRKMRLRRSSLTMKEDPYTLVVFPTYDGKVMNSNTPLKRN